MNFQNAVALACYLTGYKDNIHQFMHMLGHKVVVG